MLFQDAPCQQTMPISKGQRIRLNHVETSKWLHSHLHRSPLTGNQEVSAYGGPAQSDTGDVWTITWNGSNKLWEKANTVRGWLGHFSCSPHGCTGAPVMNMAIQ